MSKPQEILQAITLFESVSSDARELGFRKDQMVEVIQMDTGIEGWCKCRFEGKEGLVPLNYISIMKKGTYVNLITAMAELNKGAAPPTHPFPPVPVDAPPPRPASISEKGRLPGPHAYVNLGTASALARAGSEREPPKVGSGMARSGSLPVNTKQDTNGMPVIGRKVFVQLRSCQKEIADAVESASEQPLSSLVQNDGGYKFAINRVQENMDAFVSMITSILSGCSSNASPIVFSLRYHLTVIRDRSFELRECSNALLQDPRAKKGESFYDRTNAAMKELMKQAHILGDRVSQNMMARDSGAPIVAPFETFTAIKDDEKKALVAKGLVPANVSHVSQSGLYLVQQNVATSEEPIYSTFNTASKKESLLFEPQSNASTMAAISRNLVVDEGGYAHIPCRAARSLSSTSSIEEESLYAELDTEQQDSIQAPLNVLQVQLDLAMTAKKAVREHLKMKAYDKAAAAIRVAMSGVYKVAPVVELLKTSGKLTLPLYLYKWRCWKKNQCRRLD